MTDKTTDWSTGQPAKMPGWFSWRHRTNDAHEEARATYLANHGPQARRESAAERPQRERPQREVRLFTCGHRSSSANHPCGGAK